MLKYLESHSPVLSNGLLLIKGEYNELILYEYAPRVLMHAMIEQHSDKLCEEFTDRIQKDFFKTLGKQLKKYMDKQCPLTNKLVLLQDTR